MKQYLDLLKNVLDNGIKKEDRTGVGTISLFGTQTRYNLNEGFPLVTTKKIHLKSIIYELLWFLKGDTNVKYLQDNGVRIWNEWADENGDLGPVYGKQWRNFNGVDQITNVVNTLKTNPNSRRIIVSAWNPQDVDKMALPPCHTMFQFYVINNKLSCQLYQRSADCFLGVPFNIASYALLTMMMAQVCNLELGDFVHTTGDTHIYLNHIDQVKLQLSREPYPLPTMKINKNKNDIFSFEYDDFELQNYQCQRVAREKVEFVAKYHKNENILSADSIVSVNNRIIQKPKDVEDVKSFLKLYSGKNIKLYTAVYLIKKDGSISKKLVLTKAKFKHLNQRDLEDVLKEKNNAINYSCAGGLSVEGYIECFIKRIDGSYSNIIGLPLYDVRNMLISAGIY